MAAMDVPAETFSGGQIDYAPVRLVLAVKVDAAAETTRLAFLTPGVGSVRAYTGVGVTEGVEYAAD